MGGRQRTERRGSGEAWPLGQAGPVPRRGTADGAVVHGGGEVARELRTAGVSVDIEAPIGNGKTVDLLVHHQNKRIAIEVETGNSDWRANVEKCLLAGVDQVLLACTRTSVLSSVRRRSASPRIVAVHAAAGAQHVLDSAAQRNGALPMNR